MFITITLSFLLQQALMANGDTKVPVVTSHNNQIRLPIGGQLRLECPVQSTSLDGSLSGFAESPGVMQHDDVSSVMYHWRVRNRLDYTLDSDPRYRFSADRRVLEVTVPLEISDSGTYTCTGVTGFGKREVTFEVRIRDSDANLLCAKPVNQRINVKDKIVSQRVTLTLVGFHEVKILPIKRNPFRQRNIFRATQQWLKRVEPDEQYSGATKIPLPNAREQEQNELFVVLGSWAGSPAIVDKTVSHVADAETSNVEGEVDISSNYLAKHNSKLPVDQIFITRIHFQKPLEKEKHSGKYVVMTMSLTDVKSMEYAVMYVTIHEDLTFLKGRRLLVYFLVPFCLLFAIIGMIAYIFACRRREATGNSLSSGNERCIILRTTNSSPQTYQVMSNGKKSSTLQTSSRHSSNSQITGKQPYTLLGVQSPMLYTEIRPNAASNGFEQSSQLTEMTGRSAYYPVAATQMQTSSAPTSAAYLCTQYSQNTSCNGTLVTGNGVYPNTSKSTQRNLPYAPSIPVTTMLTTNGEHTAYFPIPNGMGVQNSVGCEAQTMLIPQYQPAQQFLTNVPGQLVSMHLTQSNGADLSFDQYSAVSQGQLSSSTLTNHYTAPFGEYSRGCGPDGAESMARPQPDFSRA
ncbi:Immunoglobulin domain protein [Paragonimus kellicotti]|nr:Immunoglobulin domain protein [Paragonimus kellicotti]